MGGPSEALLHARIDGLLRTAGHTATDSLDCPCGVARRSGDVVFVLLADPAPKSLGPALWWAHRSIHRKLVLMADAEPGTVARRCVPFADAFDELRVAAVNGTEMVVADPVPIETPPKLSEGVMIFEPLISASGARPIDDHGRLTAEVDGLEVARVVDGVDHEPRLEVGVGQADRELHDHVHGELSESEALARAVGAVRPWRRPDGGSHPLHRIARQRWLRSHLLELPSVLGLGALEPVAPLVPNESLLGSEPAAARTPDRSVVVVCSVGIDPNLVLEGCDYRMRSGRDDARLLLVVPERDVHPMTTTLAALAADTEVIGVRPPWIASTPCSSA